MAPSPYYYQLQVDDKLTLREAMEQVTAQFPRYGSRRSTAELQRRGWQINRKHIQRLMQEENLRTDIRHSCQTTNSLHPYGCYPNLIKHLEIVQPDRV